MSCVKNVRDFQRYLFSCLENLSAEVSRYNLKKQDRMTVSRLISDLYEIALRYRPSDSSSRFDDPDDDLPF